MYRFIPLLLTLLIPIFLSIPIGSKHNLKNGEPIPLGAYGLPHVTLGEKPKDTKRVFLLGNSVFQTSDIAKNLVDLAKKSHLTLEFENFGMTGASIADYIFTYEYIKKFAPDLIVVHLSPMTFGYNYPLFRNIAHHLLFTPEMTRLRSKEIYDLFSNEELISFLIFSTFPIFRYHYISKAELKANINEYTRRKMDFSLMDFFPYTLNLAEDWVKKTASTPYQEKGLFIESSWQYLLSEKLLNLFIKNLSDDRQKTIFIKQEDSFEEIPISLDLQRHLGSNPLMPYYDFKKYLEKEDYPDGLHPDTQGAQKAASRIFNALLKEL